MTPPALTKRIWWIVFRNEWFKARKRIAFLFPLGFYLFVTAMNHGSSAWDARDDPDRSFALPGAWSSILDTDASMFLLFFASVSLILLISSEFSWRTARQNVIDGLSKTQWFGGKVLLMPTLGLVFMALSLAISIGIALFGTDLGNAGEPLFRSSVFAAAGGMFLAYLASASLALFVALAVRGSGSATAIWFLWIIPMEQLVIPGILGRIEALRTYIQYQPFTVAQRLLGFGNYDEATFQAMVDRATEAGNIAPPAPDLTVPIWVNIGWIAVFLVGAYIMFRRRDL